MKKLFAIISTLFLISALAVYLFPKYLGFSVFNLGHAIQVSTSLSAKLACSAKYISKFSDEQIVKDISSYSPVANIVSLTYASNPKRVEASLFGLSPVVAVYNERTGCTLRFEDEKPLHTEGIGMLSALSSDDEWPLGEQASSIDSQLQSFLSNLLNEDNAQGYNTRAMLVIKDGVIAAEAYGDGIAKDTPLLGWSMGKSLTAMMLGRLEYLGEIDKNESDLFKQWQHDARSNITILQLMQMSSGLMFDETYAPGSDATHMLFTAPRAAQVALKSELAHASGSHFSYSSGTTNLLSELIHRHFGSSLVKTTQFLHQDLFKPASISTAIFEPDAAGVLVGSSYIYASGRDWARLGLIMLNDGEINGEQLISPAWVSAARSPNVSDNERAYGYQFWLNQGDQHFRWRDLPKDAYAMMGNRHQSVMIIPSLDLVLVRLGWTAGDYPMQENYRVILNEISKNRGEN
jgi:CubicO group peptidase (beta-lactamase class C family)